MDSSDKKTDNKSHKEGNEQDKANGRVETLVHSNQIESSVDQSQPNEDIEQKIIVDEANRKPADQTDTSGDIENEGHTGAGDDPSCEIEQVTAIVELENLINSIQLESSDVDQIINDRGDQSEQNQVDGDNGNENHTGVGDDPSCENEQITATVELENLINSIQLESSDVDQIINDRGDQSEQNQVDGDNGNEDHTGGEDDSSRENETTSIDISNENYIQIEMENLINLLNQIEDGDDALDLEAASQIGGNEDQEDNFINDGLLSQRDQNTYIQLQNQSESSSVSVISYHGDSSSLQSDEGNNNAYNPRDDHARNDILDNLSDSSESIEIIPFGAEDDIFLIDEDDDEVYNIFDNPGHGKSKFGRSDPFIDFDYMRTEDEKSAAKHNENQEDDSEKFIKSYNIMDFLDVPQENDEPSQSSEIEELFNFLGNKKRKPKKYQKEESRRKILKEDMHHLLTCHLRNTLNNIVEDYEVIQEPERSSTLTEREPQINMNYDPYGLSMWSDAFASLNLLNSGPSVNIQNEAASLIEPDADRHLFEEMSPLDPLLPDWFVNLLLEEEPDELGNVVPDDDTSYDDFIPIHLDAEDPEGEH